MKLPLDEIEDPSLLRGLVLLGHSLAAAGEMQQLCTLVSDGAAQLVGSANAALALVTDDDTIHVYRGKDMITGSGAIQVLMPDSIGPIVTPIRTGEPEIVRTGEEFARLYPHVVSALGEIGKMAVITYPLTSDGIAVGSVLFRFAADDDLRDEALPVIDEICRTLTQDVIRIQERTSLALHAKRLEQSNRDLESYAAVVAHDFRGPVRRIGSFVHLLVEHVETPSEKVKGYAARIKKQVTFLDQLLSAVLDYSTMVTNQSLSLPVHLEEAVSQVRADHASELENISGSIKTSGTLPTVNGDAGLLHQLITNIVTNAMKYREPDTSPVITIAAHSAEPQGHVPFWRIEVADNGIGMDSASKDSVFEMFIRLDPDDGREGTGVGLAFAKRVVEHHHGEIGVESELGVGSVFWFTLPGIAQPWRYQNEAGSIE